MHQNVNATPPRHHGSIRRLRPSRPDMPHLISALSDTSSNSSKSPSRRRRASDAKILRGAQIIRQQLLHQESSKQKLQPQKSAPKLSYDNKDIPEVELTQSISSDEFSDPWTNSNMDQPAPTSRPLESRALQRIALRQKARPWNRDLLKSKVPAHQPESTASGLKVQSWTKDTADIEETPVLVEPDQDDTLAWDIDTPVQSLQSYSFPEHGDAGQWADVVQLPRAVSPTPPPPPPPPPKENSPGNSIRQSKSFKIKTITVETLQEASASSKDVVSIQKRPDPTADRITLQRARSHDSSCSGSSNEDDVSRSGEAQDEARPLPVVTPTNQIIADCSSVRDPPPATNVVSPLSATYKSLVQNDAYRHAMSAGYLWQSLVGQHVRFPSSWWKGARAPPMGMDEPYQWMYIARHRVQANPSFNKLVRRRDSSGRLLLHIIVRDLVTWKPVQDIVIGCFHTNARGVRETEQALPKFEDCREIWMAVRKRCDEVSVVDCLLTEDERLEDCARESPLMGKRKHVNNANMRAIFGDEPPKRSVFILESELYERLVVASDQPTKRPPALILLQEFFPNPDEP